MNGSEEWTRVPSKSHRDRDQLDSQQQTSIKEHQHSVQKADKPERQPMERTPRDAGRRRDGTQVDEPPQRRNAPSGNPRGLLRVPHFARDARPPPEPPQPPSSDKTHPDRGEDWPSVARDSGARDAGRKQLWSAVVKTVPQQVPRAQSPPPSVPPVSSGGDDEEEGEGGPDETQPKKKKKRRKKKKSAEGTQSATVRRYTQPLVIELGTVLQEAAELRQAKMTVAAGAPAQALPKKSVPERLKDEKASSSPAYLSSSPSPPHAYLSSSPRLPSLLSNTTFLSLCAVHSSQRVGLQRSLGA